MNNESKGIPEREVVLIGKLRTFLNQKFNIKLQFPDAKMRLDFLTMIEGEKINLVTRRKKHEEDFRGELAIEGLDEARKAVVQQQKAKIGRFLANAIGLINSCFDDSDKEIISINFEKGMKTIPGEKEGEWRESQYTGKMMVTFVLDTGKPKVK